MIEEILREREKLARNTGSLQSTAFLFLQAG